MLMMPDNALFECETPSNPRANLSGFLRLGTAFQQFIKEELGYPGLDRFMCVYYEPKAHRVSWRDSRTSGSGSRGWSGIFGQVQTLARTLGVSVGNNDEPGDHVLLVDRIGQQARFAYREEAQEFLARRMLS